MAEVQEWCHFPADQDCQEGADWMSVSSESVSFATHFEDSATFTEQQWSASFCLPRSQYDLYQKQVWIPLCMATVQGRATDGPKFFFTRQSKASEDKSWVGHHWSQAQLVSGLLKQAGRFLLNHSPKSIGSWYLFLEKIPVPQWQRPSPWYLFS